MYEKVENQSQTTGKSQLIDCMVVITYTTVTTSPHRLLWSVFHGVVMQDIAVVSTGGNGHTTLYGYGKDMALCMKRLKINVKQRANLNS